MSTITELGEIVKDYLVRFPNIQSRRIAKWINEQHPEYSVEVARSRVRYYRGQSGVADRNKLGDDRFINQNYDLPIPSTYDSSNFIIKERGVLILADIQMRFHDNKAISATIDWAKDRQKKDKDIEAVLLNGDVLDCYQLSKFSRDPRESNIQEELNDCTDFLETIKEELGVPIYWKYGNHEERFEHYVYRQAKELAFLEGFVDLETHLDLKKYNCKVIKDKRVVKIGHLNVIHGHEYRGGISDPVNPARTYFLKAKAPTLGADKHKTSEHSGRTIDGKLITCWSIGCLCDLKPRYMPLNEWNHGFGFVHNNDDIFRVLNLRIENGVVY